MTGVWSFHGSTSKRVLEVKCSAVFKICFKADSQGDFVCTQYKDFPSYLECTVKVKVDTNLSGLLQYFTQKLPVKYFF